MCGIAGVIAARPVGELARVAEAMNAPIAHRGPDGHGMFVCPTGHAALAHRRLAIIDLNTGDQPMTDVHNRRTIVYNGEIYNYRELRSRDLADSPFATESDTEVILAAHTKWGSDAPAHLRGMFAYAMWDGAHRSALLSRDRFGEKPLFYTVRNNQLYFASELKSILRVLPLEIDRVALAQYLMLGYIPGERTMYVGVRRLRPGHTLTFGADAVLKRWAYWTLPLPDDRESERSVAEWEDLVADQLEQSVRMRMIADVPLGAFLSGGLDSSTIVAYCMRQVDRPFHTFSIRPRDAYSPDADAAQVVSRLLGTTHHEEVLDCPAPDELVGLMRHFDEPFADSSMIPTSAVSRAAREEVTVALSGDGGDEIFGGYGVYREYRAMADLARWPSVSGVAALLEPVYPKNAIGAISLSVLAQPDQLRYLRLIAHLWNGMLSEVMGGPSDAIDVALAELVDLFYVPDQRARPGPVAQAQWIDAARGYMPGDILHKVDMMAMSHSLEVRPPFLDHVLAETVACLPDSLRMQHGDGKLLLRRIALRFLPAEIVNRQKVGFSIPLAKWLSGPLRELVYAYALDPNTPLGTHIDATAARRLATRPEYAQWPRLQYSLLSLAVWEDARAKCVVPSAV